jgi:hypothetical protein
MKKILMVMLTIAVALVLTLTACPNESKTPPEEKKKQLAGTPTTNLGFLQLDRKGTWCDINSRR